MENEAKGMEGREDDRTHEGDKGERKLKLPCFRTLSSLHPFSVYHIRALTYEAWLLLSYMSRVVLWHVEPTCAFRANCLSKFRKASSLCKLSEQRNTVQEL